jgi:RNA polymerase sigma-70 factor (ECF subfamily)
VGSSESNPGITSNSGSTESRLLDAAKAQSPDAWRELVDRYSWLVFQWARNAGLSSQDAGEVVQTVLVQVAAYLPSFEKDGRKASFRRWLRTVTRTKIADFLRMNGKQPQGEGGSTAHQRLLEIAETGDPSHSQSPEARSQAELLWQLVDRLEDDFEESTWQAFWMTVVEGKTAAEVAQSLKITPNAVRIAKWRVLTRLRQEASAQAANPENAARVS